MSNSSKFLTAAGLIAAATAIWHLLCILGGPDWYAFARAPQVVVDSARQGTLLAPIGATVIAILMFICSAYAFSTAGLIQKIPLMKSALVGISIICIARAIIAMPYLLTSTLASKLDTWELIASSGWLFVGICFALGAIAQFRSKPS